MAEFINIKIFLGVVIDDDDFEVGIVEERNCAEAFIEVLRRIPGDDGDGDH